jgi:hypothetical protein
MQPTLAEIFFLQFCLLSGSLRRLLSLKWELSSALRRRRRSLSTTVRRRTRMGAGSGLPSLAPATAMSGSTAIGVARRIPERFGSHIAGSSAVTAGS